MLTSMLSKFGAWMGPAGRLAAGQFDNPEGFFEQIDFVSVNDDILSGQNSAWDAPPQADAKPVEELHNLVELESRARAVLNGMNRSAPIDARAILLKDPRALLTVDFWIRQYPQVRTVLIVRDPNEVAQSLQARGGYASNVHGLRLWGEYHRQLLRTPMPTPPIVVMHHHLVALPEVVLAEIGKELDLAVNDESLRAAVDVFRADLVHHKTSTLSAGATFEEVLFSQFCTTGWVGNHQSQDI